MSGYRDAVDGWFAALRSGATVTWPEWRVRSDAAQPRGQAPGFLGGAAHLELIRRVGATDPELGRFAALADLIAGTPPFGRGRVDVPLPWPDGPPRFGPPAIAPDALPAAELLRIAAPVLVALARRLPPEAPAPGPRPRGALDALRGRGVIVTGPPLLAGEVRAALTANGVRAGGRRATRIVLARPLTLGMLDVWSARVGHGGVQNWRQIWRLAAGADRLPPTLRTPALLRAATLPDREPPVLVVAADPGGALAAIAAERGLAVGDRAPAGTVAEPSWARTDLRRRMHRVLAAGTTPAERSAIAARVLDPVADPASAPSGARPHRATLAVPRAARGWAAATGAGLVDELHELTAAGGYAVRGEIEEVARVQTTVPGPDLDASLDLALRAIATAWRRLGTAGGR